MANGLYMVIERFKGGDAVPVYRRFGTADGSHQRGCRTSQAGLTRSLSAVFNWWRRTIPRSSISGWPSGGPRRLRRVSSDHVSRSVRTDCSATL